MTNKPVETKSELSEFDGDYSPSHEINKIAAKAHKLHYNCRKQSYVDDEGALVRDRFGQEY